MTVYYPDVSGYQRGIDLSAALAVPIKVTEGASYLNPAYVGQVADADAAGALRTAYHFLHEGNAVMQAGWARFNADDTPLALDVEPEQFPDGSWSRPDIADAITFVDAYRAMGGTCWIVYLPRWYWIQLGSPDLKAFRDRGLLVWSSDYSQPYTDDDSGAGWHAYGGISPTMWQYTSSMTFGGQHDVDFSAYRGSVYAGKQDPASVAATVDELASLWTTGAIIRPDDPWVFDPVRGLRVANVGPHSVRLTWSSPGTPRPAAVDHYQIVIRDHTGQDLPGYPRTDAKGTNPESWQGGSLPPNTPLTALVRAVAAPIEGEPPEHVGHESPWSSVDFHTTKPA